MAVKKASKNSQAYSHDVLTYVPLRVLWSVLDRHRDEIRGFAFCYHDRDVWTEEDELKNSEHVAGTLKEPHFHVILRLYKKKRFSTICHWFFCLDSDDRPITTRSIECDAPSIRFAYLTHDNDPDKYQYDKKTVVCSDPRLFEDGLDDVDGLCSALMDSLEGVSSYTLFKRYGRDFIMNHERLYALRGRIVAEPSYLRERAKDTLLLEVEENPF